MINDTAGCQRTLSAFESTAPMRQPDCAHVDSIQTLTSLLAYAHPIRQQMRRIELQDINLRHVVSDLAGHWRSTPQVACSSPQYLWAVKSSTDNDSCRSTQSN